jgi:hypothetical protein
MMQQPSQPLDAARFRVPLGQFRLQATAVAIGPCAPARFRGPGVDNPPK